MYVCVKAMFERNRPLFFKQHAATIVCRVMRSHLLDAKLIGIGARVVNMLPLYCYMNLAELLSCGAAALIESCMRAHMNDSNVVDACCRAVQNLTMTGAASVFNEDLIVQDDEHDGEKNIAERNKLVEGDICGTMVECLRMHNGNAVVLFQAMGGINNLSLVPVHLNRLRALHLGPMLQSIAMSKTYDPHTQQRARMIHSRLTDI